MSVVSSFAAVSGSLRSVPSAPVRVLSVVWVGSGSSLTCVAVCSDGRSRKFRVARAPEAEARALCREVLLARNSGSLVRFVAAGSNSPDVWFCGLV